MALMTSLVCPDPSAPSTFRLTSYASGATPLNSALLPATMPATCVP